MIQVGHHQLLSVDQDVGVGDAIFIGHIDIDPFIDIVVVLASYSASEPPRATRMVSIWSTGVGTMATVSIGVGSMTSATSG